MLTVDALRKKFEELIGRYDFDLSEEYKFKSLETVSNWFMNHEEKKIALWDYFDYDPFLIEEIDDLMIDTDEIRINGEILLVLTDDEAEDIFHNHAESYVDDCVLSGIPEEIHRYFDTEKYIEDMKIDGRGALLASYNHYENYFFATKNFPEYEWDNDIYIYRN